MRSIFYLAVLILAACQEATGPVNQAAANDVAAAPAAPENVVNSAQPLPPFVEPPGANPTAPEPASIPEKFRGLWAQDSAACGRLADHSRLTIADRSVRYPAFVLITESVAQPTVNSFAVKGFNKKTDAAAEAHFSMDVTGNILTDEAGGGAVRVRCG